MIDKPITSELAKLLYNVYEVPYLTCLTIQEYEEKAEKYKILKNGIKALNMDKDYCDVIWLKTYKGNPINEDSIEWVITESVGKIQEMLEVIDNE